jgi:FG-GAP-like repeat/FG-GAP repeat
MRTSLLLALLVTPAFADEPKLIDAPKPPDGFPRFKVQEIDAGLKIGYAVITTDIDGDAKPDIVVVDQHKVVWYQNPTWKKRTILDGKTKPDNVCITALDIDGDKLPELVVGAGWKPADTKTPGTLQWLKRGKTLDDEWTMHPIPCDEPTVHRVRAIDLDGDGKPEVVMAPLQGRDATAKGNWTDGRPVRILSYKVRAKEPEKAENWKPDVVSEELFVCHNFCDQFSVSGMGLLAVSYDGLHTLSRDKGGKWKTARIGEGDQSNPKGSRGASEVAVSGQFVPSRDYASSVGVLGTVAATIEPWHGNKVVAYTRPEGDAKPGQLWERKVVDEQLRWGHATRFVALDGTLQTYLVVGVRDNPTKDDKFTEKRGVRIYCRSGVKWDRYILEDGGVAVEDLTVADLNGDGKPDIVAVGRATGNARIYWNQGK